MKRGIYILLFRYYYSDIIYLEEKDKNNLYDFKMISSLSLVNRHLKLVSNIDFTRIINRKDYTICFNDNLQDSFSNFALIKSQRSFKRSIAEITAFFISHNRAPSIYLPIGQFPAIEEFLIKQKYKISFKDSLLVYPIPSSQVKEKRRKVLKIITVSDKKQLKTYFKVSKKVFASGIKDELYSNFPPSYFNQVENNWLNIEKRKKLRYFIAYKGRKAVSIGSLVIGKTIAYHFDLAVLKEERNKGYAKEILAHCILSAIKLKLKLLYLLTESESSNDFFYQRFGFKKIGASVCYRKV